MNHPSAQTTTTIHADDQARNFTLCAVRQPNLPHIGLVGDTYTILAAIQTRAFRKTGAGLSLVGV